MNLLLLEGKDSAEGTFNLQERDSLSKGHIAGGGATCCPPLTPVLGCAVEAGGSRVGGQAVLCSKTLSRNIKAKLPAYEQQKSQRSRLVSFCLLWSEWISGMKLRRWIHLKGKGVFVFSCLFKTTLLLRFILGNQNRPQHYTTLDRNAKETSPIHNLVSTVQT